MDKKDISQIRAFNRDYVLILGILNNNMKDLAYSLTEGRILFEIHEGKQVIANQLAHKLQLDRSYLNRLINQLVHKGLIEKIPSTNDHRAKILALTTLGESELEEINFQNEQLTADLFENFSEEELTKIIDAMTLISRRLL